MPRAYLWPLLLLLIAAITLGGGGTPAPQTELLLQLIAAGCLVMTLYGPCRMTGLPPPPRLAWIAAALVVALPLLQLVPLPPAVWQALPGREIQAEALDLVGARDTWRSWSLFPGRTAASLLAIIPAVAAMLMMSRLHSQDFNWAVAAILLMVLLSLLLGAGQIVGGSDTALRIYSQSNPGFLNGFQANRNAQADMLLIGMVAATATLRTLRGRVLKTSAASLAITALAILVLGVVLTGSRTGIALIPIVVIFCALIWHGIHRRVLLLLGSLVPAAILLAWLLRHNGVIQRIAGRFDAQSDFRSELWSDALFAIAAYWPFGAGIGSAAPTLAAVERLEIVDMTSPNRVHNDYLEFLLEAGIFGGLTIAALAGMLAYAGVTRFRQSAGEARRALYFPAAVAAIIGLHSLVDYPLRSMSLAIIAAAAMGILLARPSKPIVPSAQGYIEGHGRLQQSVPPNGVHAA
ncbi:O-antigen ligase family protein [Allopontixanthobacter sp.]|uniref:O-antigen ligase family protein n=1 Tax=Allopontixanthobacter sp. TaxID=2906452 RepID=UPI002AB9CA38|nr:O-antigen ligase family protein [Allopontixanthobacter sp.]MDZ4307496.1 O-antigen ligase family protein [Allopontixanthobacter sp.]